MCFHLSREGWLFIKIFIMQITNTQLQRYNMQLTFLNEMHYYRTWNEYIKNLRHLNGGVFEKMSWDKYFFCSSCNSYKPSQGFVKLCPQMARIRLFKIWVFPGLFLDLFFPFSWYMVKSQLTNFTMVNYERKQARRRKGVKCSITHY